MEKIKELLRVVMSKKEESLKEKLLSEIIGIVKNTKDFTAEI